MVPIAASASSVFYWVHCAAASSDIAASDAESQSKGQDSQANASGSTNAASNATGDNSKASTTAASQVIRHSSYAMHCLRHGATFCTMLKDILVCRADQGVAASQGKGSDATSNANTDASSTDKGTGGMVALFDAFMC